MARDQNDETNDVRKEVLIDRSAYHDLMTQALRHDEVPSPAPVRDPQNTPTRKERIEGPHHEPRTKRLNGFLVAGATLATLQLGVYFMLAQKGDLKLVDSQIKLQQIYPTETRTLQSLNELSDPSITFTGADDPRLQSALAELNKPLPDSVASESIDADDFYFFDSGEAVYVSQPSSSPGRQR